MNQHQDTHRHTAHTVSRVFTREGMLFGLDEARRPEWQADCREAAPAQRGPRGYPGEKGEKGEKGDKGEAGNNAGFVWRQSVAAEVWVMAHPLQKHPAVVVVDEQGEEIEGLVRYAGEGSVTVRFAVQVSGTCYFN